MSREGRLTQLINDLLRNNTRKERPYSLVDAKWICQEIQPVLEKEPSLLVLEPPINVCGDIHGQYLDLLRVFELGGVPPKSKYLFLGDYVDRGENSVEVILLLFALKLKYPDSIYLIRGNHESVEMTEVFGFLAECKKKLSRQVWVTLMKVFDCLPIAAVISNEFFCIHGGLSPHLKTLDDVAKIERPTYVPDEGLLSDLLWSDPSPDVKEWGPNERGSTISWGKKVAEEFLKRNNLSCIVRGHQMAARGFHFPFDPCKNTVTIFTASKYADSRNQAAFMSISEELEVAFNILPNWKPHIKIEDAEEAPASAEEELDAIMKARPATGRRFGKRTDPMKQMRTKL